MRAEQTRKYICAGRTGKCDITGLPVVMCRHCYKETMKEIEDLEIMSIVSFQNRQDGSWKATIPYLGSNFIQGEGQTPQEALDKMLEAINKNLKEDNDI